MDKWIGSLHPSHEEESAYLNSTMNDWIAAVFFQVKTFMPALAMFAIVCVCVCVCVYPGYVDGFTGLE